MRLSGRGTEEMGGGSENLEDLVRTGVVLLDVERGGATVGTGHRILVEEFWEFGLGLERMGAELRDGEV